MSWMPGDKDLDAYAAFAVDRILELEGDDGPEGDGELTLVGYPDDTTYWHYHGPDPSLPDAATHARFLDQVVRRLADSGLPARVVVLEVEAYEHWLSEKGLTDAAEQRVQWAQLQPNSPAEEPAPGR